MIPTYSVGIYSSKSDSAQEKKCLKRCSEKMHLFGTVQ